MKLKSDQLLCVFYFVLVISAVSHVHDDNTPTPLFLGQKFEFGKRKCVGAPPPPPPPISFSTTCSTFGAGGGSCEASPPPPQQTLSAAPE